MAERKRTNKKKVNESSMNRLLIFLLFILLPQAYFAQGGLNAVGDFLFTLVFSFVILVVDSILLFVYFFARKKILSMLSMLFGSLLVGFAFYMLYLNFNDEGEGSFLFLIPGIVYLILGTLSIVVPLIRKPI